MWRGMEVLLSFTITIPNVRNDIFIAGKLWCTEHAGDRVEAACRFEACESNL